MSLQYVKHICDANGIEFILGWKQGCHMFHKNTCLPPLESVLHNLSCAGVIYNQFTKKTKVKYIILANNSNLRYHKEAVAWHELGHVMTDSIYAPNLLEDELEANMWVMKHYVGNLKTETLIDSLKRAILTYIKAGHNKARLKYKEVGDWLGISEFIEWT